MYMAYITNPHLPKVRMEAVRLVKYRDWSMRKVARHVGVEPSTISRWCRHPWGTGWHRIETKSSKPHHHPNELDREIIDAIIKFRKKRNRCSEVVHQEMINAGYSVSLSSVKRVLSRYGLIRKRSPWKRWHFDVKRPRVEKPGDLVQIDTIHVIPGGLYVYTMLDVCSRWAWAKVSNRINTHRTLKFVKDTHLESSFEFSMLQTDHGSEFSTYFSENIKINHRHSRVRKPNDNGHLERFNRTIQDECLKSLPRKITAYRKELPEYLHYYNNERLHLGLQLKTPQQVLRSY